MAYNNQNYLRRRRHAAQITALHYEPGRQDRCHKWVWRKYIYDQFHVCYITYMRWLREERASQSRQGQLSLFDD